MVAESILSIVSSVAQLLALSVEPARRQLGYLFCFKSFVQELGEQKENLALAQDRLQNAVKEAKEKDEEIEKDVEKWMEDACKIMTDVMLLEDKIRDDKKYFAGWCPNLFQQYKRSKEVEKKTTMLKELKDETNSIKFQRVGRKAQVRNIDFLLSKDFILLNSSKEAFKVIMESLKDDKVNMIGLYGMGGVGKTTLVKEIGRKAQEEQLFHRVLMVVVSQTRDDTRIQDRLAENLGVWPLKATTKEGRAEQLLHRLQSEKKVLIILDDVWKYLGMEELRKMGISFGDDEKKKGWKILLTTRLDNLCTAMDCQKKIFLELLPENDAWDLFKTKANLRDQDDDALNNVPKKVAKECKGLPIAIVVVGTALRGKTTDEEWKVALRKLKTLLMDSKHPEKEKNVYACLKLSYDYLEKDAEHCLQLCSLFPEDHEIPIEDLTRYAIGWGLCNGAQSMEQARDQVFVAIKELNDSCLLLDASKRDHVKMHDLVREVVIQVASQGDHVFLVKAGIGLKEWPTNIESIETVTAISLMDNDITQLPKGLVCPRLKILMLGRAYGYHMVVPEKFFEGMEALEVLSLNGASLSLQALERLVNLQFLELNHCECKDPASLRRLRRLEILSFQDSSIKELPDEMGELEKLRLLDLTKSWHFTRIPANLIGRLQRLEELYIGALSFNQWDVAGTSAQIMNASLRELNSLLHLAVLSLNIPKIECIPRNFVFPKLHKYEITMGESSSTTYGISNKLKLSLAMDDTFEAFKHLFANVRQLDLTYNDMGFKNIIPAIYEGCFEDLIVLQLHDCDGLEYLVDATQQQRVPAAAFSNLKDLYVNFVDIREICSGQPPKGLLQKLQKVEVRHCKSIHTLFPAKLWQALQNLVTLKVVYCLGLQVIFESEGVDEANNVLLSRLTTLTLESLDKLECIWKGPSQNVSLQSLVHLKIERCKQLSFIFTLSLAQGLLQLETLDIGECDELEHIIGEKEGEKEEEIMPESPCLPKLTTILISDCHKLIHVFPVSVAPGLQSLQKLQIDEAKQLKQVFGNGDQVGDSIIRLPQLRELILVYVPNITSLGPKNFTAGLPSLQQLKIGGMKKLDNFWAQLQELTNLKEVLIGHCEQEPDLRCAWNCPSLKNLTALRVIYCSRLRYIFPTSIIPSLVQLKSLKIKDCDELEEIIARDSDGNEHIQSLCFPNLRDIEVNLCGKLKSLFPVTIAAGFPKLQDLQVWNARQLTKVFGQDDKAASINDVEKIVLPDLLVLRLTNLPSLARFGPAFYAFEFPRLNSPKVVDCPKMATRFSTTPNGSMSAESEQALQVAEDSSNGCSMPTSLYRKWTPQGGWEGRGDDDDQRPGICRQRGYDMLEEVMCFRDEYEIRTRRQPHN